MKEWNEQEVNHNFEIDLAKFQNCIQRVLSHKNLNKKKYNDVTLERAYLSNTGFIAHLYYAVDMHAKALFQTAVFKYIAIKVSRGISGKKHTLHAPTRQVFKDICTGFTPLSDVEIEKVVALCIDVLHAGKNDKLPPTLLQDNISSIGGFTQLAGIEESLQLLTAYRLTGIAPHFAPPSPNVLNALKDYPKVKPNNIPSPINQG